MRHSLTGMKLLATQNQEEPGLAAVYPVNKSIRQQTLIALIKQAYEADGDQIVDVIPEAIRTHYRLLSDQQLVAWMHFPETDAQAKAARRTAIFREFFLFQVQLQSLKTQTDAPQNG